MQEAIGIGFFQFDNLVRNRIPFAFFNLHCDLSAIYRGQEAAHLQRYSLNLEDPVGILKAMKYRPIDPVLCLSEDGKTSKQLAEQLSLAGFSNCYYVEGGLQQLLKSYTDSQLTGR